MLEFLAFSFAMLGLLKFLITSKMLIMMMSLEMCSIFIFLLLVLVSFYGGVDLCFYSFFLIFVVCEGVLVLLSLVNIFRGGSLMVKSLFVLNF